MLNIRIKTIPHDKQRYETVGDWFFNPDFKTLEIRVSDLNNWKFEFLIALHEFIECMLCQQAGITQQQVDRFDMEFEKNRKPGDYTEPGDDLHAPYYKQHRIATLIEKFICAEMDIDWRVYEKAVDALGDVANKL